MKICYNHGIVIFKGKKDNVKLDYDETWVVGPARPPASQANIRDRPTGTNTKQTSNKCRDVGQLPNSPQNQSQSAPTFHLPLFPGFQMKQ